MGKRGNCLFGFKIYISYRFILQYIYLTIWLFGCHWKLTFLYCQIRSSSLWRTLYFLFVLPRMLPRLTYLVNHPLAVVPTWTCYCWTASLLIACLASSPVWSCSIRVVREARQLSCGRVVSGVGYSSDILPPPQLLADSSLSAGLACVYQPS